MSSLAALALTLYLAPTEVPTVGATAVVLDHISRGIDPQGVCPRCDGRGRADGSGCGRCSGRGRVTTSRDMMAAPYARQLPDVRLTHLDGVDTSTAVCLACVGSASQGRGKGRWMGTSAGCGECDLDGYVDARSCSETGYEARIPAEAPCPAPRAAVTRWLRGLTPELRAAAEALYGERGAAWRAELLEARRSGETIDRVTDLAPLMPLVAPGEKRPEHPEMIAVTVRRAKTLARRLDRSMARLGRMLVTEAGKL